MTKTTDDTGSTSPGAPTPKVTGANSDSGAEGELSGLGARMAKGTAWLVALRFLVRSLGVISTVILARLLQPSDYGLIALASVLAASIELFTAFNFDVWLVRYRDPAREHYDTVWTLSILRGFVTVVLLLIAAPLMSAFFSEPRLTAVVQLLALALFLASWKNVGVVDFQRDLRFDRDFALLAMAKVGSFTVTVAMGIIFRSYWALLAGIMTQHILTLVLSFTLHSFRPRFSLRHWKDAFAFSKWLLLNNVVNFAYRKSDTFILGKIAGGQLLGIYTVAREIASLASTELATPVRRAMLPGYAKMSADIAVLRKSYLDGFALILLIGAPCALGISVVAEPLVKVVLGSKWLEAIPVIEVLVLYGISSICMANQSPVLLALGKVRTTMLLSVLGVALLWPLFFVLSSRYGIWGGALGLGITNCALLLAGLVTVQRVVGFTWLSLTSRIWRSLLAALVMAIFVKTAETGMLAMGFAAFPILVACTGIGLVLYFGCLLLLWVARGRPMGPEQVILDAMNGYSKRTKTGGVLP